MYHYPVKLLPLLKSLLISNVTHFADYHPTTIANTENSSLYYYVKVINAG